MLVRAYVTVVALIGAATATCAALLDTHRTLHPLSLLLFAVLLGMAEYLQVRHPRHNIIGAVTLTEGILAPLVFTQSGLAAVVVSAVALSAANLARRNAPLKSVFNVAMWVAATAAGSLLVHAFGTSLSLRSS